MNENQLLLNCAYQKGAYPSDQCYNCNYAEDCWGNRYDEDYPTSEN